MRTTTHTVDDRREGYLQVHLVSAGDKSRKKCERTPSACESASLADRGSEAVELTTNGGGSGLGGKETKAVSGTELTKTQENAINYSKGRDMILQLGVETAHDETKDGL